MENQTEQKNAVQITCDLLQLAAEVALLANSRLDPVAARDIGLSHACSTLSQAAHASGWIASASAPYRYEADICTLVALEHAQQLLESLLTEVQDATLPF